MTTSLHVALSKCIYLDNAASTPVDPRVLEVMTSVWSKVVGNAHAKHHVYGATAAMIVQKAREQIAASINASPEEIVFTSGATESNNLAIKGLASYLKTINKMRILVGATEHKSVLEPLAHLQQIGFTVKHLPVKPCGMVLPETIEDALDDNTGLVCLQAVNNETGTIQPIAKIAPILRSRNVLLHCDAAQSLGKIPFSITGLGADLAGFSSHKVYGPQGIGCLYIKTSLRPCVEPQNAGGGQELGLRSGTLPVALCAGFGVACAILEDDLQRLQTLRELFLSRLAVLQPIVYGHRELRGNVPGILCIRLPGIDSDALSIALDNLAVGLGSACSSTGARKSHVLEAMTGDEHAAEETIRLSFGRFTTEAEIIGAADAIVSATKKIRDVQEDR